MIKMKILKRNRVDRVVQALSLVLHFHETALLFLKVLVAVSELNCILESEFSVAVEQGGALVLHVAAAGEDGVFFSDIAEFSF